MDLSQGSAIFKHHIYPSEGALTCTAIKLSAWGNVSDSDMEMSSNTVCQRPADRDTAVTYKYILVTNTEQRDSADLL